MGLTEIGCGGMDWIDSTQDRREQQRAPVNTRDKPSGKFLSSCIIGGFSRRAQLHVVS
jgi:hypothetical protein